MDGKDLLHAYRQLWVNRSLTVEKNEIETLYTAIEKDLKDEMTHPRLRKSFNEKFHLAIKRIVSSLLSDNQKVKLIDCHIVVLDKLKKNNEGER
jgi:translation elongation factor EF-G